MEVDILVIVALLAMFLAVLVVLWILFRARR